jgi:hypothetical protein
LSYSTNTTKDKCKGLLNHEEAISRALEEAGEVEVEVGVKIVVKEPREQVTLSRFPMQRNKHRYS